MGLCWSKLATLSIVFSVMLIGNAAAQVQDRPTLRSLIMRKQALKTGTQHSVSKEHKSSKKIVVKKTSIEPETKIKVEIQEKVKVPYTGTSYVEPTGVEEKEVILFPIQTSFKIRLVDDVSNMNAQQDVIAELIQDNGVTQLKSARLLGSFRVMQKGNRMYLDFHTLVLSNGTEIPISGYAVDATDKKLGLIAHVDDKVGENILKIVGQTASALLSAATLQSTNGISGQVIDKTAAKHIDAIDTDSVVTLMKGTLAFVKLSKALSIPKY